MDPKTKLTNTQIEISRLAEQIKNARKRIQWLKANADKIESIGLNVSTCCGVIDFDNPTREQALEALKAFAPKWEKAPGYSNGAIHYIAKQDGITLRLYDAPPPPSCQLVEEEVLIPSVPARIEKRMKLVCKEAE